MSDTNIQTESRPDPLLKSSLGGHLAFWSILFFLSTAWAMWDEFVGKRGYLGYQAAWAQAYEDVISSEKDKQEALEEDVKKDPSYVAWGKEIDAIQKKVKQRVGEIKERSILLQRQVAAISAARKRPAGLIGMVHNRAESAAGRTREKKKQQYEKLKNKDPLPVELPQADGTTKTVTHTFAEWTKILINKKTSNAETGEPGVGALAQERGRLGAPIQVLRKKQADFLDLNLKGLELAQLASLLRSIDTLETGIKQVHVEDVGLVDRCTTCHLGALAPIDITRKKLTDIAGVKDPDLQALFMSHPRPDPLSDAPDLLDLHPPARFGCSPCHGGNGTGTISTHLAHGLNKHWMWKLYARENFEAGCQQCHDSSLVLPGAPVLNAGRELFRQRGCWSCHKREGFNIEVEQLTLVSTALKANSAMTRQRLKEQRDVQAILDDESVEDDETLRRAGNRVDSIRMRLSSLETERATLSKQVRNLNLERKRQGPNLKELRAKIKRDWILPWLEDPRGFRPTTTMPQFRFEGNQAKAIAAFLWQNAIDPAKSGNPVAKQAPADATKGRELFETRGCMACHTTDDQERKAGGFAADLSRVGEKVNYDYLARWIYDPRQRLAPYSPELKARTVIADPDGVGDGDVMAADYAQKNLAPKWDRDNTVCPQTGGELVVENQTVMPTLRLTWDEARQIASYLATKRTDKAYPPATFLNDTSLFKAGRKWVKHYGCAGCHEIKGFEEEAPVGTELTKEGSKPIERLDFGLLTFDYKRTKDKKSGRKRYSHKHFFMDKLKTPEIFDKNKVKPPEEKLKMPNFGFADEERIALTTFLLGSVDSQYPDRFYYRPQGAEKDIERGWWLVKKYNCVGCHTFRPGDIPAIQQLEWFRGETKENIDKAAPQLVGQGFRTNPKWLTKFLQNPALVRKDNPKYHGNGVRPYLNVRMPTFKLTNNEVQILVRFFAALANQALPKVDAPIDPLTLVETAAAKAAFAGKVCLKCHVTDQPPGPLTNAPSFLLAAERLNPDWMRRWMVEPSALDPTTKMPGGIFTRDPRGRWVFAGRPADWPPELRRYDGDHANLLVRYMRQYNLINPPKGD
ncbi:MAG: hypothetical protein CMJ85_02150 [Planctomycetes bacterium]|nr:hypothetical protein [Planctomycetota bacterium]